MGPRKTETPMPGVEIKVSPQRRACTPSGHECVMGPEGQRTNLHFRDAVRGEDRQQPLHVVRRELRWG